MPLSRRKLEYLAVASINATAPAVILWKQYTGEISSTFAGLSAVVCLLFLNTVFLLAMRSKRRQQGLSLDRSLIGATAVLAVISALVTVIAANSIPVRNDYLGLALSGKPLNEIQPEQKRLVVELIRNRAAMSQEYDRSIAEAKKHPMSPALYTPESFASVEVMRSTSDTLQKYLQMDLDYYAKLQQSIADFRRKMERVDPVYLKSWDQQQTDQERLQASTVALEQQWMASVVALYGFAETHYDEVKLYGSPAEHDDSADEEFKKQLAASKALFDKWQQQAAELATRQNEARARNVPHVP